MCELEICFDGGWDWLDIDPNKRSNGETFSLTFRGKVKEKGGFGHKEICTYLIEVTEIISAKRLT